MDNQPLTPVEYELPLTIGTIYTRADGRSATVQQVIKSTLNRGGKKSDILGVQAEIVHGDKKMHGLIRLSELLDWQLQKPTAPVEGRGASFPIGQFFEMTDGVATVAPTDPELTATAARIQQLQKDLADANSLIESLENRIERVTEERDEAIDELSRANDRADDLGDSENYETRAGEFVEIINDLRAKNTSLTEALAEARAQVSPILNAASADTLTPPKQEVCVERNIAEHEFTARLNAGWHPIHIQFMPTGAESFKQALNVVFVKTTTTFTDQPRRAVTAVGPTITIQPVEGIHPSMSDRLQEEMEAVLAEGERVYTEALAASPIAFRPLSLISGGQS